jgi:hypothetical protein
VHKASIDCLVFWNVARGRSFREYAPAADVTRAQMATFIANAVVESGDVLPEPRRDYFPDDAGSPHESNINRLAAAGIVTGRPDGTYAPSSPVARGAMAKFLALAYEYTSQESLPRQRDYFADDAGTVFEEHINAAASVGIASGYADGYRPNGLVRRDHMAAFLARWLDLVVERLAPEA